MLHSYDLDRHTHLNIILHDAIATRSDTITMPTDEMFDLMRDASRGDDVYGEDQATNDLQDKIAKMAGKEAGLFCVSGTMVSPDSRRLPLANLLVGAQ